MHAPHVESAGTAVALATAAEVRHTGAARGGAEHRASRLAARRAISALAGREVGVIIRRTPGGAPTVYLRGRPRADAAAFALSLSHRDDRAAAVAAPAGARVGVDLERRDAVNPAHAGYFLTPRERVGRTLTLAELWALKEAAWKALALDGAVAFHELELHVDGAGRLRALTLRGRRMAASATLGTPWPGYVLATVVVEGRAC